MANRHQSSNSPGPLAMTPKGRLIDMSVEMTDCPYCERRVLPNNGICPGCGGDLNNEAVMRRHKLRRDVTTKARTTRAQGASLGEIEAQLQQAGADEEMINEIILELEGKAAKPEVVKEENEKAKREGLYWLVGGILVTGVTYWIAASSQKGGYYLVAWGAILFGGLQFIRAWLRAKE